MLQSLLPTFASRGMRVPDRASIRALDWRSVVAVVAAIVLLLCTAGASVWQAESNSTALRIAQSTRRDRNSFTDLLMAAQDAETSQRGYLLTGDPMYLDPLQHAETMLRGLLPRLQTSAPGEARIDRLRTVLTARFAELRQTVDLAQRGDLADAMAIVRTNAGSIDMALIRKIIAQVEAEQDAKLLEQVAKVSRGSRLLVAIDVAGLIMVLALGGLIALGLRDYLTALRGAQAKAAEANAMLERNNDRLDDMVRMRTAELTSVNDEVQRFAYIVSHDLRAPLVNIMGFTSELQQAAATLSNHLQSSDVPSEVRDAAMEEIPEALGFIKTSTQKMDRLINAILKLSREGRRVLVAEQLDMTALLTGLMATMQHQADAKRATVDVAAVPALRGDRLAVEQVFGNVVENALKYLQPGRPGTIRVTGRVEGAMARFEVADNGRGIATKDFERVFELFRRAGDQSVPGEGIGLAHVRTLVRRMGGTIECKSEVGTGSTFTISLPVVAKYTQEVMI
jgi:signal transduction histidine kinase